MTTPPKHRTLARRRRAHGLALAVAFASLPSCGSGSGAAPAGATDAADADAGTAADASDLAGGDPWRNRTPAALPAAWPPAATLVPLAFDGARGRVLMFGGGTILGWAQSNDLFEWDGDAGQWDRLTPTPLPAAWPKPLGGHAMAWDARRKKLVVFGGYDFVQIDFLNPHADLWELDSATLTWTNRTPAVLPASWPAPRYLHALVYDSARDKTVLFGGWTSTNNFPIYDDLWEWDGDSGTWTDRTPSPRPAAWPKARYHHAMVYDSQRQRTVLFGGYVGGPLANDIWEWDGAAFVNRTPSPLPAGWPPPRDEHAVAYDPVRARMLVFGGYHPILGDTWEWNGATNDWGQVDAPGPSPRRGATMAFDARRQVAVMFGGEAVDLAPPLPDTWEYGASLAPSRDAATQ
jgi:hypothetical protein